MKTKKYFVYVTRDEWGEPDRGYVSEKRETPSFVRHMLNSDIEPLEMELHAFGSMESIEGSWITMLKFPKRPIDDDFNEFVRNQLRQFADRYCE